MIFEKVMLNIVVCSKFALIDGLKSQKYNLNIQVYKSLYPKQ